MVGRSGVVPAHESPTRGPIQNALLDQSFVSPQEAAGRSSFRAQLAAQHEADVYEQQAEQALKQQDAFQAAAQKRALEMERLRTDYMGTVQSLGEAKVDNNRLWANASTMDRIGTIALVMLGNSEARAAIQKKITDDVDLQKWEYEQKKDVANATHTAFGMAMQQYGSEDAAEQAAIAAGQLATSAKMRALASQWKGTESANQFDMAAAGWQHDAAQSAAAGWRFIPPAMQALQYRVAVNGFELPAPVSGAEANKITLEHGAKAVGDAYQTRLKGGIESVIQDQKSRAEIAKEAAKADKQFQVVLPTGQTINAPSEKEADTLREISTSTTEVRRLVAEAKKIRSDSAFRVTPQARGRLGQIQADLKTHFAVQNKLGALSDSDTVLAVEGTADLFNVGSAVEARLDRLNNTAIQKVQARVATYPGAPDRSAGKMPSGFKAQ